jgi:hypothetical protein
LTVAYRVVEKNPGLGLVTERHLDLASLGEKVIKLDQSAADFDAAWVEMPLRLRLLVMLVVLMYAFWLRLFGTRAWLASQVSLDDLPSRDEIQGGEMQDNLEAVLLDNRDATITSGVDAFLDSGRHGRLGLLYGAQHARAIVAHLSRRGYRVTSGEWLTAFVP